MKVDDTTTIAQLSDYVDAIHMGAPGIMVFRATRADAGSRVTMLVANEAGSGIIAHVLGLLAASGTVRVDPRSTGPLGKMAAGAEDDGG